MVARTKHKWSILFIAMDKNLELFSYSSEPFVRYEFDDWAVIDSCSFVERIGSNLEYNIFPKDVDWTMAMFEIK